MTKNDSDTFDLMHWWAVCQCKQKTVGYCGTHDATYCLQCFAWLESKCSDEHCTYCTGRPPYNAYAAAIDLTDEQLELNFLFDLEDFFGPPLADGRYKFV